MTDSPDLFAATREHDLPPKWDGCPVEWGPWREAPPVLICPPPKGHGTCPECGSTATRMTATGLRHIAYGDNVVRVGTGRLQPREMTASLSAVRCPDCMHDIVVDLWTDSVWDLDPTDYEDEGSNPPT